MFKALIRELSHCIEMCCYHKRHRLVLEVLWEHYSDRHPDQPPEHRKQILMDLIEDIAERKG